MYTLSMEQTTIRITQDLHKALESVKAPDESFENLLWDLIEPYLKLSDKTEKDIEEAKKEYLSGKTFSLKEVKEELNL